MLTLRELLKIRKDNQRELIRDALIVYFDALVKENIPCGRGWVGHKGKGKKCKRAKAGSAEKQLRVKRKRMGKSAEGPKAKYKDPEKQNKLLTQVKASDNNKNAKQESGFMIPERIKATAKSGEHAKKAHSNLENLNGSIDKIVSRIQKESDWLRVEDPKSGLSFIPALLKNMGQKVDLYEFGKNPGSKKAMINNLIKAKEWLNSKASANFLTDNAEFALPYVIAEVFKSAQKRK